MGCRVLATPMPLRPAVSADLRLSHLHRDRTSGAGELKANLSALRTLATVAVRHTSLGLP